MKTDVFSTNTGVKVNAVSLDGFIVRETLAKDVLVKESSPVKQFTAADLWNIQKGARKTGWRS